MNKNEERKDYSETIISVNDKKKASETLKTLELFEVEEVDNDNLTGMSSITAYMPAPLQFSGNLVENFYKSMNTAIVDTISTLVFKGEEDAFKGILSKQNMESPKMNKVKLSENVGVEDIFAIINKMKYNNSTSANFLVSAEMFDKLKNKTDQEGNYIIKRDDVIDGYTILNHEVHVVKCLDEEDGIIFADFVNGYLAEVSEDFHLTTEQHGMYLRGKIAGRIVDYDCFVVAQ